MNADPFGVAIISISLALTLYAIKESRSQYNELGTQFFRYATFAFSSVGIMIMAYLPAALFSGTELVDLVTGLQLVFASFGILALAFLASAIEFVKKEPNDSLINGAFLISGATIASRFFPDQYSVTWTNIGWQQHYGIVVLTMSVLQFSFIVFILGPIVFRVIMRINKTMAYKQDAKILFVSFVVLLAFFGIFKIAANSFDIYIIPFSADYYLFLILLAGMIGLVARLLHLHPTIFFSQSYDIFELQFLQDGTYNLLYRYKFNQEESVSDTVGIPIAQESIKQVFNEALETPGDVRSIRVEDIEVLVAEGNGIFGILLAQRSSELFHRLLKKSLELFEATYQEEPAQPQEGFNSWVENYYQFALDKKQVRLEV